MSNHLVQLEILKILAPLSDNPNTPGSNGLTPINFAVENGYLEIIKIMAPLLNNPTATNIGITLIHRAMEIYRT